MHGQTNGQIRIDRIATSISSVAFLSEYRILLEKYYASSWQGMRTHPTPLVCLRHYSKLPGCTSAIMLNVFVALYLLSILLTQPWDTWRRRLISHGRTPCRAIWRISTRRLSGSGRPLVNMRPYWLTALLPAQFPPVHCVLWWYDPTLFATK